jgi:hypothetical protein
MRGGQCAASKTCIDLTASDDEGDEIKNLSTRSGADGGSRAQVMPRKQRKALDHDVVFVDKERVVRKSLRLDKAKQQRHRARASERASHHRLLVQHKTPAPIACMYVCGHTSQLACFECLRPPYMCMPLRV